jgi:hypothetical protein
VNASCAPSGVSFAFNGVVHVRPSSLDDVTSTSVRFPFEKRTSCHVAYSVPLGATANIGTVSPVRRPGTGSDCISITSRGAENVRPPSFESVIQSC